MIRHFRCFLIAAVSSVEYSCAACILNFKFYVIFVLVVVKHVTQRELAREILPVNLFFIACTTHECSGCGQPHGRYGPPQGRTGKSKPETGITKEQLWVLKGQA